MTSELPMIEQEGIYALQKAIEAHVYRLDRTREQATIAAAWWVTRSLQAATTQRKTEFLPVKVSQSAKTSKRRDKDGNVIDWVEQYGRKGNRIFWVERYKKDGTKKKFTIWANTLAEAKQSKTAKMRYWGLAKRIWGVAMNDVNQGGGLAFSNSTRDAVGVARGNIEVMAGERERGDESSYEIQITNFLKYAAKAFKGGMNGQAVVNSAMKNAAAKMRGLVKTSMNRAGEEFQKSHPSGGYGRHLPAPKKRSHHAKEIRK
jgi:hypothetical protein